MATQPTALNIKHLSVEVRRNGNPVKNAEALDKIQNAYASLSSALQTLQASAGSGSGPSLAEILAYLLSLGFARSLVYQFDLVSGANVISYADPLYLGDRLALWLRQNGAGDGTVSFDTNLLFADPNAVTNLADSVCLFSFCAMPNPDNSNTLTWFCIAPANAEQIIP